MTRAFNHNPKCPNCGTEIERTTAFSRWLRGLPSPHDSRNFSNQNLDYIWHNYREHWFITIEEKIRGGGDKYSLSAQAQQDTHGIVAQLLKHGDGRLVDTLFRGKRAVRYRGHYLVAFQNETPDDSKYITINDVMYAAPHDDIRAVVLHLLTHGTPPPSNFVAYNEAKFLEVAV